MLDRPKHRLRAPLQSEYTDPAILTDEQAALFDEGWVMVGREGCVPNPGDYMAAKLGERPIAVVRQRDGTLKAFANFCLHRYARLLDGTGNSKRIVCPYHAWTYNLDGQLIGVPDREGFCNVATRELSLEELACASALGFVFVSRRTGLAPPSTGLAPLAELMAAYDLAAWQDRHVVHEDVWHGNWKGVFENFIESYHVTYAHPGSIGPTNPTALAEQGPTGHAAFSLHSNTYRPQDAPEVHNPRLSEAQRRRFNVIGLYPNGLAAADANFMWWIALEPISPETTNARWGLSFAPEAMAGMDDPDRYVETIRHVISVAIAEDKEMVARVQEGARFASREPGYLHDWLEVYVHEFQAYVARTLAAYRARP